MIIAGVGGAVKVSMAEVVEGLVQRVVVVAVEEEEEMVGEMGMGKDMVLERARVVMGEALAVEVEVVVVMQVVVLVMVKVLGLGLV